MRGAQLGQAVRHMRLNIVEFDAVSEDWIEVRAEELLVKERLKRSREDSEADFDVYRKIKNKWQPLYEDHLILHSTDDNLNAMLEKTAGHLQQMNDKRTNK